MSSLLGNIIRLAYQEKGSRSDLLPLILGAFQSSAKMQKQIELEVVTPDVLPSPPTQDPESEVCASLEELL